MPEPWQSDFLCESAIEFGKTVIFDEHRYCGKSAVTSRDHDSGAIRYYPLAKNEDAPTYCFYCFGW